MGIYNDWCLHRLHEAAEQMDSRANELERFWVRHENVPRSPVIDELRDWARTIRDTMAAE